jgi:hypothetical protein
MKAFMPTLKPRRWIRRAAFALYTLRGSMLLTLAAMCLQPPRSADAQAEGPLSLVIKTCSSGSHDGNDGPGTSDEVRAYFQAGDTYSELVLDRSGVVDRQPGSVDTYFFGWDKWGNQSPANIDALKIEKFGGDDWCVSRVELQINGQTLWYAAGYGGLAPTPEDYSGAYVDGGWLHEPVDRSDYWQRSGVRFSDVSSSSPAP